MPAPQRTLPLDTPRNPGAVPPPRPRLWPWLLLGLIVFAGGGELWLRSARQAEATRAAAARPVVTAIVQRGTFEVRVRLTGQVSARIYSNIIAPKLRSPAPDRPMTLLNMASTGLFVQSGAVIAEFDPQSTRDHLDDTRDGLHDRINQLDKFRASVDLETETLSQQLGRARAKLDKARIDLRTLVIRSANRSELMRIAVAEAEAEYRALEDQFLMRLQSQAAALRIREIDREMEGMHVARHQQDLDRLTLHAPVTGVVVAQTQFRPGGQQVTLGVGDRVAPGALIMRVIDRTSMQVEGAFNQSDSSSFRIGQEATIRLDGYPGLEYHGRVYAIGSLANTPGRQQFQLRTIPIRLEILNPDEHLLPDLTASADVLVEREEGVLLAPARALKDEGGQTVVYVQTSDGIERRPVTRRRIHGSQAALTEGVAEGEIIVVE